jgi:hypothetical protein
MAGRTGRSTASVRGSLLAAMGLSVSLLWIAAFEAPFSGFPEGLLVFVAVVLIGVPFLGCSLWSVWLLRRIGEGGFKFAVPLLVCAATMLLLAVVPFSELWLQRNFWWYRADRERIVARVEAGDLAPNVSYNSALIALGNQEPPVSVGGNDIVVEKTERGSYVLFLTERGLRHTFSGFLHVPPDGDPEKFFEFTDKPPFRLVPYGQNWYFVVN